MARKHGRNHANKSSETKVRKTNVLEHVYAPQEKEAVTAQKNAPA
jgi:hypothetical protein